MSLPPAIDVSERVPAKVVPLAALPPAHAARPATLTSAALGIFGRGLPDIDELAVEVYRRTLIAPSAVADVARDCGVSVGEATSAFERLRALKLVRPGPTPGCYVAVSPSLAEMEVIEPLEQAIQDEHRALTELRSRLWSLNEVFEDAKQAQQGSAGVFRCDAEEARLWLARAAARCTSEILMLQPVESAGDETLPNDLPLGLGVLEQGKKARVIRQHMARNRSTARASLNELAARGVEVRTTTELAERLIIFDRSMAFVRQAIDETAGEAGANSEPGVVVVTEASMVSVLAQVFEQTWRSAVPYDPAITDDDEPLDEVKGAILELLASGVKDEVIARRLGMSPRTYRRHMSSLMEQLNASSRFQAGLVAARRGLLTT
jgi:DNA-binding CsgD family transcriptional regulator